jgi:hypothetical protein
MQSARYEHTGAHENRVLVCGWKSTINRKEKMNQPKPSVTQPAQFTRVQEIVVRHFIDMWNLSMPYHDIGAALNCGECNALHEMLLAFNATEAAQALMDAHVAGDDEGDDPKHFRLKTTLEKN